MCWTNHLKEHLWGWRKVGSLAWFTIKRWGIKRSSTSPLVNQSFKCFQWARKHYIVRLQCVQCENRTNPSITTFPPKAAHRKKWGLVCRRLPQPLGKTSATVGTDWHHLPCSQRHRQKNQTHQHLLNKGFFQPIEINIGFTTNLYYPPAAYNQTLK